MACACSHGSASRRDLEGGPVVECGGGFGADPENPGERLAEVLGGESELRQNENRRAGKQQEGRGGSGTERDKQRSGSDQEQKIRSKTIYIHGKGRFVKETS